MTKIKRWAFLCILLCISTSLLAQKVDLHFDRVRLDRVFSAIEAQTGLIVSYSSPTVDPAAIVSVSVKDADVCDVLNDLLAPQNITAEIAGNKILLKRIVLQANTIPENQKLTGTVTDAAGDPLPGVSILIKGTKDNFVSDSKGQFTAYAPIGSTLQFIFLGMKTQEVVVENYAPLYVVLQNASFTMEDVFVVAYGTAKKSSYTGSASVVSSRSLEERPLTSFSEALSANVPGLLVTGGAQPGSMPHIRVRGIGSMNASNAPLYVIDGVVANMSDMSQLGNISSDPMTTINPNDIESISVLKDAASAALYGSRAANGVVLITTKQGKEGKLKIETQVMHGVSDMQYIPDLANKDEFVDLWVTADMHSLMRKKALSSKVDVYDYIKQAYADPGLYETYLAAARKNFNTNFKIEGNYYDFWGDGYDKYPDTDWWDEITRTGTLDKVNLSVSGGKDKLTFFTSGEYYNLKSPVNGAGFKRFSGRVNISSKINKLLWTGANINLSCTDQAGPQNGAMYANPVREASILPPVVPVRNADGSFNAHFPYNFYMSYNPIAIIEASTFSTKTHRSTATVWAQLNILEGFTFKTTFGYDLRNTDEFRFYPPGIAAGKNHNGILTQYYSRRARLTTSNVFNYAKTIARHEFSVMAGFEAEETESKYFGGQGTGFQTAYTPVLNAASVIKSLSGNNTADALLSVIAKTDYNYDKRYYVSVSYRRDGSSRFASGRRWGDFYSVSAAWRISQEKFMEALPWMNEAKLRASYGTSGTLPSGLYDYVGNFVFGNDYNSESGAVVNNVENLFLTWEKNQVWNAGIDLGFLKNRINWTLEYYNRASSNLLLDKELSRVSGYATAVVNLGKMRNRGFETTLKGTVVDTKKLYWDLTFNFASLQNELVDLPADIIDGQNINRQGYAQQSWFMVEYAGIDKDTGEPQWYKIDEETGEKTTTKNFSEGTRRIFGNYLPKYSGGLSTSVSYAGFDLSALFSFGWGFKVYDYSGAKDILDDGYSQKGNKSRELLDNWRPDNPSSDNPLLMAGIKSGSNFSTRYLHDGNYLKIKSLKLGYTLSKRITNALRLSKINIYLQGDNLFTWCALENFDPEVSTNGKRYIYQYPTTRTVLIGINLAL